MSHTPRFFSRKVTTVAPPGAAITPLAAPAAKQATGALVPLRPLRRRQPLRRPSRASGPTRPTRPRPGPRPPRQRPRPRPPQEAVAVPTRLPPLPHPLLTATRPSRPQLVLPRVAVAAPGARRAASGRPLPPHAPATMLDIVPATPTHRKAVEGPGQPTIPVVGRPAGPVQADPAKAREAGVHPGAAVAAPKAAGVARPVLVSPRVAALLPATRGEGVRPGPTGTVAAAGETTVGASEQLPRGVAVVLAMPSQGRGAAGGVAVLPGEAVAVPAPVAGA